MNKRVFSDVVTILEFSSAFFERQLFLKRKESKYFLWRGPGRVQTRFMAWVHDPLANIGPDQTGVGRGRVPPYIY